MTTPADPVTATTTVTNPPAAAQNTATTTGAPENMIPQSRFNEINERAKTAEAELAKIKTEREEADRKAAERNGEWQKLAEQHTAELSDVKPKLKAAEESSKRYGEALAAHVTTLLKDVPAHIKGLLDKLDPVEQLEWITKNGDQLGNPTPRGNGPNPRPAGQATHETRVQENQQKLQSTGAYNSF